MCDKIPKAKGLKAELAVAVKVHARRSCRKNFSTAYKDTIYNTSLEG